MKKTHFAIWTLCFGPLLLYGQTSSKDTTDYQKRTLQLTEINLLHSYYHQDGENSAVTGGIGTEKLTDFSNIIKINFVKEDQKGREHNLGFDLGIDFYSSASSDNIDPATISSASSSDTRIYPHLSWQMTNEEKNFSVGTNISFSREYDYQSQGIGMTFSKFSNDHNRELSLQFQSYFDTWKLFLPIELRPPGSHGGDDDDDDGSGSEPRNSYSASFVYSQVINRRLQIALLADIVYQQGFLSTPFHRVYFQEQPTARVENLPGNRFKLPLGIRASYFFSDFLIARAWYRYYTDEWNLAAHTFNLELPVKINSFFSIYPFYRYYTQTAADYFAPYGEHSLSDTFYTSDFDLSAFDSHFIGAGVRYAPPQGILQFGEGAALMKMIELRYGHYSRSTGLNSNIISLHLKVGKK